MCPLLSGVLYLGIHCTIQQSMVKRIVLDFCLEYFVEFQSKTYANTCMASSWLKSSCVSKSDEQLIHCWHPSHIVVQGLHAHGSVKRPHFTMTYAHLLELWQWWLNDHRRLKQTVQVNFLCGYMLITHECCILTTFCSSLRLLELCNYSTIVGDWKQHR